MKSPKKRGWPGGTEGRVLISPICRGQIEEEDPATNNEKRGWGSRRETRRVTYPGRNEGKRVEIWSCHVC